MLGRKTFSRGEFDAARSRVDAAVRAYGALPNDAKARDFEATFFNNAVRLLDYMFVHRLSGVEGKDGNPLNEVRVLCNSILLNGGKLQVEKLAGWPNSAVSGLRLPPETSVLRLVPGDDIKLTEADFVRLSTAFFTELERRYAAA
jgi:hypothetical protein